MNVGFFDIVNVFFFDALCRLREGNIDSQIARGGHRTCDESRLEIHVSKKMGENTVHGSLLHPGIANSPAQFPASGRDHVATLNFFLA
jgi:hypothetical protein